MSADREIAIIGAGMHPWGKWGRNFVEYGVVAAQAALADAGVEWPDVQFVSGGETVRNGYPGYVAGATFAQALGWNGAQVASSYAACASGATALGRGPRPDPGRVLRRRAGDRRRHDAQGLPRTQQGRARRRPRLAPVPPPRRDQPDLLRPLRPPAHGAVRRDREDFAQVKVKNARHGLDNPYARYRKEVTVDDVLAAPLVSDPLAAARHLRDQRRRAPRSSCAASTTPASHGAENPVRVARDLDGHAELPADRPSSCPTSRPTAPPAPAAARRSASSSRSRCRAYEEAGLGPDDLELRRGLRPLHRDGARLVRADRPLCRGRGREAAPRRRDARSAAACP